MPDAQAITFEISDEAGQHSRQSATGQRLVIGRSADCAVRLDRTTVSRRHAELFCDPFQRWWVRDLGSRNGTQVNGETVAERMIGPGDLIGVGEFSLRVAGLGDSISAREPEGLKPVEVSEMGAPAITTLKDVEAPRISSTHLSILNEFGQRLLKIIDPMDRLRSLCKLMVRDEFHGDCALVMRVAKAKGPQQTGHAPRILVPPETAPRWRGGAPYISRTMLRSLSNKEEPTLASNVPMHGSSMMAEISLSPDVMSISTVACPVHSDDQTLDVLYVILPPQYGTGEWLALAALAAKQYQQAEMTLKALANQSIEIELERARKIQEDLVPRNKTVPGLELAIGFQPCKWVGGDYVDVINTADGRTLLVVADVCGKGMGAALLASGLHTVIRVGVISGTPLPDLMKHLNGHLCETLNSKSFVTMVCVLIDPKTGQLQCVNTGHPGAILIRPDGSMRLLQCAENPPLGVDMGPLVCQSESLSDGELLVLYTDGLSDLSDSMGTRLGSDTLKEKLQDIYRDGHRQPVADLGKKLTEMLDGMAASAMAQDDRTFLLARRA